MASVACGVEATAARAVFRNIRRCSAVCAPRGPLAKRNAVVSDQQRSHRSGLRHPRGGAAVARATPSVTTAASTERTQAALDLLAWLVEKKGVPPQVSGASHALLASAERPLSSSR